MLRHSALLEYGRLMLDVLVRSGQAQSVERREPELVRVVADTEARRTVWEQMVQPVPGVTDHNAGQQDCFVNPEVDSALTKVAAKFPGLVTVGKKFYSPACRSPVDGAHLGNNNTQVAKDIAAYYKTMP
jgi:hypothetical protein